MYLQPEPDTCKTAVDVIAKAHAVRHWRDRVNHIKRDYAPVPPPTPTRFIFTAPIEEVISEPVSTRGIQRFACKYFCADYTDLIGEARTELVILQRHITIWVVRKLLSSSSSDIGRKFGDRDHTTILHAIRKIQYNVDNETEIGLMAQNFLRATKKAFAIPEDEWGQQNADVRLGSGFDQSGKDARRYLGCGNRCGGERNT